MAPRHRVEWTRAARRDLAESANFISEASRRRATRFVERVLAAASSLGDLSERGRVVPELGDPRIREMLVDRYRLMYVLEEERVVILGLLHQRRDFGLVE